MHISKRRRNLSSLSSINLNCLYQKIIKNKFIIRKKLNKLKVYCRTKTKRKSTSLKLLIILELEIGTTLRNKAKINQKLLHQSLEIKINKSQEMKHKNQESIHMTNINVLMIDKDKRTDKKRNKSTKIAKG